jgi:hypothetical protein
LLDLVVFFVYLLSAVGVDALAIEIMWFDYIKISCGE